MCVRERAWGWFKVSQVHSLHGEEGKAASCRGSQVSGQYSASAKQRLKAADCHNRGISQQWDSLRNFSFPPNTPFWKLKPVRAGSNNQSEGS